MQTTSKIIMVRPARFAFNEETAENNYFQIRSELSDQESEKERISEEAIKEFDAFVKLLRANDVDVTVVQDTPDPHTPDSIFPNNWFSSHFSGELVLYPMFAPNRRDRKSTRLNSSHVRISYAVFCLKKKNKSDHLIVRRSVSALDQRTSPAGVVRCCFAV